jgi:hypothetical protein
MLHAFSPPFLFSSSMYGAGGPPADLLPRRRPGDVQRDPYVLVEQATAEHLRGEPDWAMNMTVTDLANQVPQDW